MTKFLSLELTVVLFEDGQEIVVDEGVDPEPDADEDVAVVVEDEELLEPAVQSGFW